MTVSRNRRGLKLLLELCVIVAGVLIALGADAWWDAENDARRSSQYLRGLRADMLDARSMLAEAVERTNQNLEQTTTVLAWLRSTDPIPDSASAGGLRGGADLGLPLGTLSALLVTGDINLIRSEDVRATIISEQAYLARDELLLGRWADLMLRNVQDLRLAREAVSVQNRLPLAKVPLEVARGDAQIRAAYSTHGLMLRNRVGVLARMSESVDNILRSLAAAGVE